MKNYFAAANTAHGFVSWFDDIFDPRTLDFTYIIKGGSGTGKSTLMKKVAAKAEGLGADVEYFYCSSDPTSLDGIIMHMQSGKSIAMLDGTAPHTHDPKFPGAAEAIINLGEYWCEDILKGQKNEIIALGDEKATLFREGYSYFSAAGKLLSAQLYEIKGAVLKDKLDAACARMLSQRMHECRVKGSAHRVCIRPLSALSTEGEVHLDSFSDCERVSFVSDIAGSGAFFFDGMLRAAKALGLEVWRAPMPLLPELTEALYFPALSMSVVSRSEKSDVRIINMARFVERDTVTHEERIRLKSLKRTQSELVAAGLSRLAKIHSAHAKLEKIYIGAMDFTRLGTATEQLLSRIFA